MRNRLILILIMILIAVTVAQAATFTLSPDSAGETFLLDEDVLWSYDMNVSVTESLIEYSMEETTDFSNISLGNETGIINLTATNDEVGNYSSGIVFIATNRSDSNDYVTARIYFNISNINDAPNITLYQPDTEQVSVNENKSLGFSFNVTYADQDVQWGDYLIADWYVDGVINETNRNNMTFFPGFCDSGEYNITVVVQDVGNLSDRQYWNVTVDNINRVPVLNITIENRTWNEDTNLLNNLTLTEHMYDPDRDECTGSNQDNLSFIVFNNDSISVIINNTNYNVSFYPAGNLSANVTIFFGANDSNNITNSNNLTLNVVNVNDAPELVSIGDRTAGINVQFDLYIHAVDPDIVYGDILNFSDNSTLFNITRYNSTSGLISFIPQSGQEGNYTVNISVNDTSGITDFEVINFEITTNDPPELSPIGTQDLTQGTVFSLIITGGDSDDDAITFSENASFFDFTSYNSTAVQISFTPSNAQVGNYSVNITVEDAKGAEDFELVEFRVNNLNDAPVLGEVGNQTLTVDEPFIMYVNASDIDMLTPYNDTLTFSDNATIFNISYHNGTTALINFTPSSGDAGNHSINISVNDSSGVIDFEIVVFTVVDQEAPVLDAIGNLTLTEDSLFTLYVNVSDANNDNVTFTINATALNVTPINITYINRTLAIVNLTPTQYDVGNFTIRFNVSDTTNRSDAEEINITVLERNDPPILTSIGDQEATEETLFTLYLYASDEEGANLTFAANVSFFNISYINETSSLINFTPANADVDNHSINISVNDGTHNTSEIIEFKIENINNVPTIDSYTPAAEQQSVNENSSLNFTITASDQEGANLTYHWYLNNVRNSSIQNFTYYPGFCEAGIHNITVMVNDSQAVSQQYWNVTVNNTNRPPVFGKKIYASLSDFNLGTYRNTSNGSAGNITLALNGSKYYTDGTYESAVIDFGDDNTYVNMTVISWTANVTNGTNVTFRMKVSTDNVLWTDWGVLYSYSGEPISETPARYIQFQANLSTNDTTKTPTLYDITINYYIGNHSFLEKFNEIGWIDLDDYFYDSDSEECGGANSDGLNFSAYGNSTITVTITTAQQVSLYSASIVTELISFYVDDGDEIVYSNNISMEATENVGYTGGQDVVFVASGGGGTTTISSLAFMETSTPFAFDIITPEEVTVYENDTLVTPITLENNEDFLLKGIKLIASSSNENIKLNFSVDTFDELGPGNKSQTELYITSYLTYGSYEIVVTAMVDDPKFNDTAKFFVNSYELGEKNRTQLNTRITFTRDLFNEHPECLELNEMLERAVSAVNNSQYSEAARIIDQVTDDCRYLISMRERALERPFQTFLRSILNNRTLVYASGVVLVLFLGFGIFVFYLYRKSTV